MNCNIIFKLLEVLSVPAVFSILKKMTDYFITEWDMILRLVLGFIAGAILGFERSSRRQTAGLRTYILISLGASLLMILSIWIPQEIMRFQGGDPGRIAAQVVSGIGFLGAGAIIRLGNNIRGLTTAAALWFSAAVGLAVGAGMFTAAAIAEAIALITLIVLEKLERKIFPAEHLKNMDIIFRNNDADTERALDIIKSAKIRLQSINVVQGTKSKRTKLVLLAGIPVNVDITQIVHDIKSLEGVIRVEIKEKY